MVTPFFKNIPILPLNDGYDMPQIGVASFRRDPEDKLREILLRNLDKGLRHVEICDLFGNGHTVADIILEGGAEIRRDKLFLTLKIWPKQRKRQDIILAFKEFLFGSNLEYVDLLMIHGPLDVVNRIEQYKAMEELKQEGFVRSIGLSNMTHTQLSNILKKCNICPAVIEVFLPLLLSCPLT
jgi:diketogulonate reductase-like aldo/keto reductase